MRKIKDIKKEISENLVLVKNQETEPEVRAASLEKLEALSNELRDAQIAEAAERSLAGSNFSESEKREASGFSFVKFLREAADGGRLTGFEAEMAEEARKEASRTGLAIRGIGIPSLVLNVRADPDPAAGQNVTTPADGGRLVEKYPLTYIELLRKRLVLAQMGATYLPNLVGNVPFAKGTAVTSSWGSEFESLSTVSKAAFTVSEMTPKRLGVTTAFSRQLLLQTGGAIEQWLLNEMIIAHAAAIEEVAIEGGGTSEPTGILGTAGIGAVVMGASGAPISWAKLVELETKITSANADLGALAYLTNSKVRGALKTIERASGTARFLMENGEANGYKVYNSNLVPSDLTKAQEAPTPAVTGLSAMIFGNFNDLLIGQWGGLDIVVDPYSLKKTAQIETTINAFHDVFVRNAASFAAAKDITT